MADLFNTERCGLPQIPKLDFDFVDDCDVLPSPEPFFQPPDPILFPTPPIPIPTIDICIEPGGFALIHQEEEYCGDVDLVIESADEECAFTYNFNFELPFQPQAALDLNIINSYSLAPVGTTPRFDLRIEDCGSCPSEDQDCCLNLFVDWLWPEIPVPDFDVNVINNYIPWPQPTLDLDVLCDNYDCTFNFTANLPDPNIFLCPEMSASATMEIENDKCGVPWVDIKITKTGDRVEWVYFSSSSSMSSVDEDFCRLDFEFDFYIPPLPMASLTAEVVLEESSDCVEVGSLICDCPSGSYEEQKYDLTFYLNPPPLPDLEASLALLDFDEYFQFRTCPIARATYPAKQDCNWLISSDSSYGLMETRGVDGVPGLPYGRITVEQTIEDVYVDYMDSSSSSVQIEDVCFYKFTPEINVPPIPCPDYTVTLNPYVRLIPDWEYDALEEAGELPIFTPTTATRKPYAYDLPCTFETEYYDEKAVRVPTIPDITNKVRIYFCNHWRNFITDAYLTPDPDPVAFAPRFAGEVIDVTVCE